MITQQELEKLFEILNAKGEQTLDACLSAFQKEFGNEPHVVFKYCYAMQNLILDNILTATQRLVAFYIIVEIYKADSFLTNPFAVNIVDVILEHSQDNFEKKFVYQLITRGEGKMQQGKQTIKHLLEQQDLYTETFDGVSRLRMFKQNIINNVPQISGSSVHQQRHIVSDFGKSQKKGAPLTKPIDVDSIPPCEIEVQGFSADHLRPIPQPLETHHEELIWMNPILLPDVMWDYNICNENNINQTIKELMLKAQRAQLSPEEQKLLMGTLDKDPNIIYNTGMAPALLPDLVEKNVEIASQILIKLQESPTINQYFEKLVNMELTLSSLEVVNKLVHAVQLPQEFLHLYISNCIQQCEEQKKDKNTQNRLVRLVCVFIKSLIKNKIINPKDMYIELQAFCIEFSKTTEASSLFKMLKSLDNPRNDK